MLCKVYLAQWNDSINSFISPRVVDHHEDGGRKSLRNVRALYTGRLKFPRSFHIAKTYRLMLRGIITVLNITGSPEIHSMKFPNVNWGSYNETNYMHCFLTFIFTVKLYMFRTVPVFIIRSFSLYTQQWYMSYNSEMRHPRCVSNYRKG